MSNSTVLILKSSGGLLLFLGRSVIKPFNPIYQKSGVEGPITSWFIVSMSELKKKKKRDQAPEHVVNSQDVNLIHEAEREYVEHNFPQIGADGKLTALSKVSYGAPMFSITSLTMLIGYSALI